MRAVALFCFFLLVSPIFVAAGPFREDPRDANARYWIQVGKARISAVRDLKVPYAAGLEARHDIEQTGKQVRRAAEEVIRRAYGVLRGQLLSPQARRAQADARYQSAATRYAVAHAIAEETARGKRDLEDYLNEGVDLLESATADWRDTIDRVSAPSDGNIY